MKKLSYACSFTSPSQIKTVYIHMYIRKTNLFNIQTFILPYLSITMIDTFLIQIFNDDQMLLQGSIFLHAHIPCIYMWKTEPGIEEVCYH